MLTSYICLYLTSIPMEQEPNVGSVEPKSKLKVVLGVIVVLAVVAAALAYFFWPKGEETPPSLTQSPDMGEVLQGRLELKDKIEEGLFNEIGLPLSTVADVQSYKCPGDVSPIGAGLKYYYLGDVRTGLPDTIGKLGAMIDPVKEGSSIVVFAYDAAENSFYVDKEQYAYVPVGAGLGLEVKPDYKISTYSTLVIGSTVNTSVCGKGLYSEEDDPISRGEDPKDLIGDLSLPAEGWVLAPLSGDGLRVFVEDYNDKYEAIWPLTRRDANMPFQNMKDLTAAPEYHVVWVLMGEVSEEELEEREEERVAPEVTGADYVDDMLHVVVSFDEAVELKQRVDASEIFEIKAVSAGRSDPVKALNAKVIDDPDGGMRDGAILVEVESELLQFTAYEVSVSEDVISLDDKTPVNQEANRAQFSVQGIAEAVSGADVATECDRDKYCPAGRKCYEVRGKDICLESTDGVCEEGFEVVEGAVIAGDSDDGSVVPLTCEKVEVAEDAGTLLVKTSGPVMAKSKVMQGAKAVTFFEFTLTAEDKKILLHSIKLTKGGLGDDDDLEKIELYAGEAGPLATIGDSNRSSVLLLDLGSPYVIEEGTSEVFTVKVDIDEGARVNNEHLLSILSADDIDAGDAVIEGNFPVVGNPFVVEVPTVTCTTPDGTLYNAGESYTLSDGCNKATCQEDGTFLSTLMICLNNGVLDSVDLANSLANVDTGMLENGILNFDPDLLKAVAELGQKRAEEEDDDTIFVYFENLYEISEAMINAGDPGRIIEVTEDLRDTADDKSAVNPDHQGDTSGGIRDTADDKSAVNPANQGGGLRGAVDADVKEIENIGSILKIVEEMKTVNVEFTENMFSDYNDGFRGGNAGGPAGGPEGDDWSFNHVEKEFEQEQFNNFFNSAFSQYFGWAPSGDDLP